MPIFGPGVEFIAVEKTLFNAVHYRRFDLPLEEAFWWYGRDRR
jgi:hypothetical protein